MGSASMRRQRLFAILLLSVLGFQASATGKTAGTGGLSVSADSMRANLLYVQNKVLPAGWKLASVQKWNAYGNSIKTLAPPAAEMGMPICVLTNQEAKDVLAAAKAAGVSTPAVWRIMPADGPAKYDKILQAAKAGLGITETMTPLNQADILAAAKAAGVVIPVQIYLFSHYENKYGYYFKSAEQLEQLLKSLDSALVKVEGFFTHNGGLTKTQALERIDAFNKITCPVAKRLAAKQPVRLHFASSTDVESFVPKGSSRMQVPADLCQGANINWMARIGSVTFGEDSDDNSLLQDGTSPVLTWYAAVGAIRAETLAGRGTRKVAVVELGRHRYPAPSWWKGVQAFIPSSKKMAMASAASYQPDSYVYINGHKHRLLSIPSDGSQLLVDVTRPGAGGRQVAVGDKVCILCADHTVGDLGEEVGADGYNTALCLTGQTPVVGSMEDTPQCSPEAT